MSNMCSRPALNVQEKQETLPGCRNAPAILADGSAGKGAVKDSVKRMLCCLLVLMLLPCISPAEGIDRDMLEAAEGVAVSLDANGVDTVYRFGTQPFFGRIDGEGREVCAYLDLVEYADMGDCIVPRLMLCVETDEEVYAEEVIIKAGGHAYVFTSPGFSIDEYDMTYYEDYTLLLVGNGRGLLKDLAGLGNRPLQFQLGENVTGEIQDISAAAKNVADLYRKAGGEGQELEKLEEAYPVEIRK